VGEVAGTDTDIIEVKDYDTSWPAKFQMERDKIVACLGDAVIAIDHIGSTSVPGLKAKPVIDIMVSVRELDLGAVKELLLSLDYAHVPIDDDDRLFFRKGMPRTHHLHVVLDGSEAYWRHIRFRDRLKAHPEEAKEYAQLKEALALRYRTDRDSYLDGKDLFIKEIMARDAGERSA
jgi:GrpB-like predicted nucleotidyltransferase (UPF0157 family)